MGYTRGGKSASGIIWKAKDKFKVGEANSDSPRQNYSAGSKLTVDIEREAEKRVDLSYLTDSTAQETFNPVRAR